MKIAVLGTGMVGKAVSGRLAELGHHVTVGTRDPDATRARDGEWPTPVATYADAAAGAELVVNATNGQATLEVLGLAGAANLADKVLVDISNPLDFSQGMPPTLSVKDTDSLGEQVQRAFPDAHVVKTLNTLNADLMVHPESLGRPSSVFVSGDDAEAKAVVSRLLAELGHEDVIDLGGIETARGAEMYLPLWLRLMGSLGTPRFNLHVVR
jgi:predicted dinucleotide-binding enzyme